jgi:hypothetical protein
MRAHANATTGFVVSVLALAGAILALALTTVACTYTTSGQGGPAAALELGDAAAADGSP